MKSNKESWERYVKTGIIPTDNELANMIRDLGETITFLEVAYGQKAAMALAFLRQDYYGMSGYLSAREEHKKKNPGQQDS